MKSIILINLPARAYISKDMAKTYSYNPSISLMSLGAYLELHGYCVKIFDLCIDRIPRENLIDIIANEMPLLVGISVYTENLSVANKLASAIKQINNEIKICLGGPGATLDFDSSKTMHVDFSIFGEGESTLLELVECIASNEKIISYEDIEGLYFNDGSESRVNKTRGFIKDLDLLPIIKRELCDFGRFTGMVNISSSRGCPGKCIFCAASALSGASYRVRDVKNLYMELVYLSNSIGERSVIFYFVDDTFTAIPRRVEEFTNIITESNIKLLWHCESRVDVINKDLIAKMKMSGCVSMQFGLESGSQLVLNSIKKNIDLQKALEAIRLTSEAGITMVVSFILGHYCDTKDSMMKTVELIKELYDVYAVEVALSYNTPFPGTWQYINRDKIGLKIVVEEPEKWTLVEPVAETDNFTINDLREIYNLAFPYLNQLSKVFTHDNE